MTIKVTIVTTVSNQQRVRIYLEVCNDRLLVGGPRGQALVSVEQVPRPLHLQLPEHGAAPIRGEHLAANHSSPEGVGDDQDHDEETHKEDDEGGQDGSHVLNMAPSVSTPDPWCPGAHLAGDAHVPGQLHLQLGRAPAAARAHRPHLSTYCRYCRYYRYIIVL